MKKYILSLLTVIFILGISIPAFATPIESASNVFYFSNYLDENVSCNGDAYAFSTTVKMGGSVKGDIITAASMININTDKVEGSIRAAGATIDIASQSVRNITAVAQEINISSNTVAQGIYVAGNNITFDGKAEDVYVVGSNVILNGTVTGKVKVECDNLIIGKDAKIDGIIEVKATQEPTIEGNISADQIKYTETKSSDYGIDINLKGISLMAHLFSMITAIIIAMILTLLCNKYLNRSSEIVRTKPWLPLLIGFATLVILPIAAILVLITIVGIPVSMISLMLYGILIYIAPVVCGVILGRIAFKNMNVYLSALIGVVGLKVIMIVPYLGGVLFFIAILLSLGLFVQNLGYRITEQ